MRELTLSLHYIEKVLYHADQRGLDCNALLTRAGIAPRLLHSDNARISAEQYASLQRVTMREMNDEILGYCQRPFKLGTWNTLCRLLIDCRNLLHVIKRFCFYFNVFELGFRCEIKTIGSQLCIRLYPWQDPATVAAYGYEIFLFGFYRISTWLVAALIPLDEMQLPYPQPDNASDYRLMFNKARLSFNAPHCEIRLPRKFGTLPVRQDNDSLRLFLGNPLLNMLTSSFYDSSWTAKTQALLRKQLHNIPTLNEVALQLQVHPKKLRRELEAEGISYIDLKTELRRDIAITQLSKSNETIETIAQLTGFSETSTFSRAFRQWTGVTPAQYRQLASKS